jgi:hypothetical protein
MRTPGTETPRAINPGLQIRDSEGILGEFVDLHLPISIYLGRFEGAKGS